MEIINSVKSFLGISDSKQSTNEYVNISDIRGEFLYTKNNLVFQYIKVSPISTALMNDSEKKNLTSLMTKELSPIGVPFKIIFLSRPADIRNIIEYYENIKSGVISTVKREAISKNIKFLSSLTTNNGVLERQTFIALWANQSKQVERELNIKTLEFVKALTNSSIQCSVCDETDISSLVSLFYNPTFRTGSDVPMTNSFTFMEDYNE